MSVCSTVGCPEVTKGGRCDGCKAKAEKQRRPDGNPYNSTQHRKVFRTKVLDKDPICVVCRVKRSTVADHYPLSRRELVRLKLDPNDPDRGRGVCKPCHDRETAQHQPGGWNAR